ncbi:hypothetical protein [Rhizobium johnstonii]|uniref:hypothetical protein n=1 Tax=Rhizobium johnstonii TaxID=3019933 RepID=UPI002DDD9556|nr:hypothetical protein U8P72_11500 [Rhizobium johnstonii]
MFRKFMEYGMEFRIADLKVQNALRDWMGLQFGGSCVATTMLMLLTIVNIASRYVGDFEMRQMQVLRKAKAIVATTGRPQRVPTYREFESMFDQYERQFYRDTDGPGTNIVSTRVSGKIADAIIAHGNAAARSRIGGPQAA